MIKVHRLTAGQFVEIHSRHTNTTRRCPPTKKRCVFQEFSSLEDGKVSEVHSLRAQDARLLRCQNFLLLREER